MVAENGPKQPNAVGQNRRVGPQQPIVAGPEDRADHLKAQNPQSAATLQRGEADNGGDQAQGLNGKEGNSRHRIPPDQRDGSILPNFVVES